LRSKSLEDYKKTKKKGRNIMKRKAIGIILAALLVLNVGGPALGATSGSIVVFEWEDLENARVTISNVKRQATARVEEVLERGWLTDHDFGSGLSWYGWHGLGYLGLDDEFEVYYSDAPVTITFSGDIAFFGLDRDDSIPEDSVIDRTTREPSGYVDDIFQDVGRIVGDLVLTRPGVYFLVFCPWSVQRDWNGESEEGEGQYIGSEDDYGVIYASSTAADVRYFYIVVEGSATQPVQPPDENAPDGWAVDGINAAIAAGLVPDSIINAGWQNNTSRVAAAEAMVLLLEVLLDATMDEIAVENGWDLTTNQFIDTNNAAVTFLRHAGVVGGIGGNMYDPDGVYSRAMIVTMIGGAAEAFLGIDAKGENPFTDIDESTHSWAVQYVGFAAELGIVSGLGDGIFNPDGPLQNQMIAILNLQAWRALD